MRHKKFSSISRDLTDEINNGSTYKTKRHIDKIIVHCSFSPQGRGDDAHTIDKWHLERWGKNSGCGYHVIVKEDGTIQKGRWMDYSGSHVKGHNKHSIGICRIGGMRKDGTQKMDATNAQIKAIRKVSKLLASMYDLPMSDVIGHSEVPRVKKSCPLLNMNSVRNL